MSQVTITIDGIPVAKARPRFSSRGGVYTPSKTRTYEKLIGFRAVSQMQNTQLITEAVEVQVKVFLPLVKSWSKVSKAKALVGEIMPTKKPDLDNYIKSALDGIAGIVIKDDNQVVNINSSKYYGISPRMVIAVNNLGKGIAL